MKKVIGAVVLFVVIGAVLLAFIRGQKERASEAERERPVKAASRVSVQNNERRKHNRATICSSIPSSRAWELSYS